MDPIIVSLGHGLTLETVNDVIIPNNIKYILPTMCGNPTSMASTYETHRSIHSALRTSTRNNGLVEFMNMFIEREHVLESSPIEFKESRIIKESSITFLFSIFKIENNEVEYTIYKSGVYIFNSMIDLTPFVYAKSKKGDPNKILKNARIVEGKLWIPISIIYNIYSGSIYPTTKEVFEKIFAVNNETMFNRSTEEVSRDFLEKTINTFTLTTSHFLLKLNELMKGMPFIFINDSCRNFSPTVLIKPADSPVFGSIYLPDLPQYHDCIWKLRKRHLYECVNIENEIIHVYSTAEKMIKTKKRQTMRKKSYYKKKNKRLTRSHKK